MINEPTNERGMRSYSEEDPLLYTSNTEEAVNINQEKGHTVGTKSLNFFYSVVFIINQIYGPGVLAIPAVFQQSGFLFTTIVLGLFAVVSCFSSTLLCEALSLIPGNKYFDKHIEYTGAVRHYFGHKWYMASQLLMNLCMQSYNIASIVVCAQSLDQAFYYILHKTYALKLIPFGGFVEVKDMNDLYGSAAIYISIGYILITLFCMPAGFLNLEDNVKVVQLGSFVVLVVLMGEICGQFFAMKFHWSQVPAIGSDYSQLVSIFIFSWAYVMFIPSWVNEKKNDVSTNKVVWVCGLASFMGYLLIGMLAALVVSPSDSDDLLQSLSNPNMGFFVVTVIASYIFSLGVIAPGIPVCCITTRYNLYIGKVCGKKMSYFWGVIAPWMIAFFFCQSKYFNSFINWSSLVVNGVVNFLIPLILYFKAISVTPHKVTEDDGTQYITDLTFAPSTVEPWPKFMRRNAKMWTAIFFVLTAILVGAQVTYAVYLMAKGDSPFS